MVPFLVLHTYVYVVSGSSLRLTDWQSVHENRIYGVKIHCGPDYPDVPPEISFTSKINLPCVDQRNGKVCAVQEMSPALANGDQGGSKQTPMSRPMEARIYHGDYSY
jgi:hypothetical protein